MKKFLLFFVSIMLTFSAFAQLVTVTEVKLDRRESVHICLSDGYSMKGVDSYSGETWELRKTGAKAVALQPSFNRKQALNFKRGQIIRIFGDKCQAISLQKIGVYTIKSIKINNIYTQRLSTIGLAYKDINDLFSPSTVVSEAEKAGVKSIANIVFDNGKIVSIIISGDPFFASVAAGQKVEHYKLGSIELYKLVL